MSDYRATVKNPSGEGVIGTMYSVRDAEGFILCHAPSQDKGRCDSTRKRAVREAFRAMCDAAGAYDHTTGEYLDVVTGAWLPMADGDTSSQTMGVIERGHVVPDEARGAFCPCNLVPENRGSNKGHGKRSLDPRTFRASDPRAAWFDVWSETVATPSRKRAAVRDVHPCCGVSARDYCQC